MHEHAELRDRPAPRKPEPAPAPAWHPADPRALVAYAAQGGNHALARALLQRDPPATAAPPGRGVSTEFGDYWIVPDDTMESYDVIGEQITETEFSKLEAAWVTLKDGKGQLVISEKDWNGVDHPGFGAKFLLACGQLMSRPLGRELLVGLINGSQLVTVQPSESRMIAAARRGAGTEEKADGTAGPGGTTTIRFDDDFDDKRVEVFDKDGKQIPEPLFIALGHELIHAKHNAAGRNKRAQASTDPAYPNREEQDTIEGSGLSESTLRAEHGLPGRHGHALKDMRP